MQPIIVGGAEADRVVEELLAASAPVLLALDFPDKVKGLEQGDVSAEDMNQFDHARAGLPVVAGVLQQPAPKNKKETPKDKKSARKMTNRFKFMIS